MNGLSVFYSHIRQMAKQLDISNEMALKKAVEMGYTHLECNLGEIAPESESLKLLRDSGLQIASVYYNFDFSHESLEQSIGAIDKYLETIALANATKCMPMPGVIKEGEDLNEAMKVMCDRVAIMTEKAKQYGITVTIEDYYNNLAPYSTSKQIEYFLDNIHELMCTIDTGNFAFLGEDNLEIYDRLKDRIVHAHLKDFNYDPRFKNDSDNNFTIDFAGKKAYPCEVGMGSYGVEKLVEKMVSDGYNGIFTVEVFGAADMYGAVERSAENLKKILGNK